MAACRMCALRCECGSDDLVAVAPGAEAIGELFTVVRGVPVRGFCATCWARLFKAAA